MVLTGRVSAELGPIFFDDGKYFVVIKLDEQKPWPADLHNGMKVTVTDR